MTILCSESSLPYFTFANPVYVVAILQDYFGEVGSSLNGVLQIIYKEQWVVVLFVTALRSAYEHITGSCRYSQASSMGVVATLVDCLIFPMAYNLFGILVQTSLLLWC